MDKKKITERVTDLAAPIVEEAGLELVDVEYVRERDWFLRVFIDKAGGIDIDDCSAVSNALAKKLDDQGLPGTEMVNTVAEWSAQ